MERSCISSTYVYSRLGGYAVVVIETSLRFDSTDPRDSQSHSTRVSRTITRVAVESQSCRSYE